VFVYSSTVDSVIVNRDLCRVSEIKKKKSKFGKGIASENTR